MRSSNPALNNRAFSVDTHVSTQTMTVEGTATKTGFLLTLALLSASWVWYSFSILQHVQTLRAYMFVGLIGGFIFSMCTIFKPRWSPITAPIYAVLEGLFLGSISTIYHIAYAGIVFQALLLTFGTLGAMLVIYRLGIIKVTQRFRKMLFSATSAICFMYLLSYILSWFGITIPYIHESSPIGILFSLVVVGIAAFHLLLDFDFIEKAQQYRAPKYMEWYGAFALMLTLVWLYIEILRLLAKLRNNRRS